MKRIAVTGSSGNIGKHFVERLLEQPEVEQVLGLDIRPLAQPPASPKFSFEKADVRDPAMAEVFQRHQIDTVLHLAFIVDPIHDGKLARSINIDGTKNVLEAVRKSGIKDLLVASSSSAYGARPDNPPLLTEESPLRGGRNFPYADEKKEMDEMARAFAEANPDIRVVIVRPCLVLRRGFKHAYMSALNMGLMFSGFDAPQQYVHIDDLTQTCTLLLQKGARGVFNISGEGTIRNTDLVRMMGGWVLPIPVPLIRFFGKIGWMLRLSPSPDGVLDYMCYPLLMSTDKVRKATGFTPRTSQEAAVETFLSERARQRLLASTSPSASN